MLTPTPLQTPENSTLIAAKVHADRLQLLFRQSLLAVYGSFGAAGILAWLYWDRADQAHIVLWLMLLAFATLGRGALFLAYFRSPVERRSPRRWEKLYWITLVISASIWGLGALAVMPKDDLLSQSITLFFAIGMSGSAVSTYSAYRSMTMVAIALVMLPCSLWLLWEGGAIRYGMILAAAIFSASVMRATRELSDSLEKAFRLSHEMELAHRIVSFAAQTDELTGLKNRRAFFENGEQWFSYCKRNQLPLIAWVLDIDHFKNINDSCGHQAGDEVLRRIGQLLQDSFRESDICARLGGEEFAVLLIDTPLDAAMCMAENLRASIANLDLETAASGLSQITASIGVAALNPQGDTLQQLLHRADAAMYRAKEQGRNRVVEAEPV